MTHYKEQLRLWNEHMSSTDAVMTPDQFIALAHSNPWISHKDLMESFHHHDRNRDGTLTFEDIWQVQQEDDINWRLID